MRALSGSARRGQLLSYHTCAGKTRWLQRGAACRIESARRRSDRGRIIRWRVYCFLVKEGLPRYQRSRVTQKKLWCLGGGKPLAAMGNTTMRRAPKAESSRAYRDERLWSSGEGGIGGGEKSTEG